MILFLEWYDLDRGVAHLGQGVAQRSQVVAFQADVAGTLLAEALPLAEIITCRSALAVQLVEYTLSWSCLVNQSPF